MSETRIPTQKRSIEKRNKIIEKGFELMCEKGYYNISTPDIAEAAEVSTGIIYQYFNDKKEIFIEELLKSMINTYIKNHTISKKAHEELMAMSHLDDDIANIFKESEFEMTNKILKILEYNDIKFENPTEKIHIIIGIVENLCHEIVYHKHNKIDYENMQKEVIKIVINLLK